MRLRNWSGACGGGVPETLPHPARWSSSTRRAGTRRRDRIAPAHTARSRRVAASRSARRSRCSASSPTVGRSPTSVGPKVAWCRKREASNLRASAASLAGAPAQVSRSAADHGRLPSACHEVEPVEGLAVRASVDHRTRCARQQRGAAVGEVQDVEVAVVAADHRIVGEHHVDLGACSEPGRVEGVVGRHRGANLDLPMTGRRRARP